MLLEIASNAYYPRHVRLYARRHPQKKIVIEQIGSHSFAFWFSGDDATHGSISNLLEMCLQYIITREKLRPFHIPEFSNLHFIGAPAFRRPQLGNLHLMEEHSVIRFYLKKAANIEENTVLKVINV